MVIKYYESMNNYEQHNFKQYLVDFDGTSEFVSGLSPHLVDIALTTGVNYSRPTDRCLQIGFHCSASFWVFGDCLKLKPRHNSRKTGCFSCIKASAIFLLHISLLHQSSNGFLWAVRRWVSRNLVDLIKTSNRWGHRWGVHQWPLTMKFEQSSMGW